MNAAIKLPLTARTIAFALIGLVVVAAAAGWFLVVSPKRSEASKLAAAIESKQSLIAVAKHQQSRDASGKATTGSAEAALDAAMPDAVGMPQVVDELNRLADRAGVTLDTVSPQASVLGTGYVTIPLNVVVDGQYFGVEKFLHLVRTQVQLDKNRLKAEGRLFDVQGVQLQQTEPAPMVTATLSLDTFYYSPTATTAAPDTTTTTTTG